MTTTAEPHATERTTTPDAPSRRSGGGVWIYLLLGAVFGLVLTKGEVVSWFRIQEMFRFQAFHMYGVLGSAVVVPSMSLMLIRRYEPKTLTGEDIVIPPKQMGKGYRYWLGGSIFGVGWALTGACPGPMFALAGSGVSVIVVAVVAGLVGTWSYGILRPRLPH